MLPVVAGRRSTLHGISSAYTLVLVVGDPAADGVRARGPALRRRGAGLGAVFLAYAVRLWRHDRDLLAMRTFRYSIVYLFLLFGALALDHAVQDLVLG